MLKFVEGGIYHIQNIGCGRQAVFFQKRNYRYFIRKIIRHISPYAKVLGYKLKSNQIHLLIRVEHLSLFIPERNRVRTLAESIGLMLRSYAQAINKQENRTGVLWQGPTKVISKGINRATQAAVRKEQLDQKRTSSPLENSTVEGQITSAPGKPFLGQLSLKRITVFRWLRATAVLVLFLILFKYSLLRLNVNARFRE